MKPSSFKRMTTPFPVPQVPMEIDDDENDERVSHLPPSWFEFLLDRTFLERHLNSDNPDPSSTILLSQFVLNAEKSAVDLLMSNNADPPKESEESMVLKYRQKKSRSLRLISMQTAAFLSWDLDILSKMHIDTQHLFMKLTLAIAESDLEDKGSELLSKEFLRVLYHRWVLRTFQCHNTFAKTTRFGQQTDQVIAIENVWKGLNEAGSVEYLKKFLNIPELLSAAKVIIPSPKTFEGDIKPDWSVGFEIDKSAFESMVHLDLGTFLLYKGNTLESVDHFQNQQIPLENFPFLKISKNKLEGYLRAVGLLTTFDQQLEDSKVTPQFIDHTKMLELSLSLRKGLNPRLKKLLNVKLDPPANKGQDRLNLEEKDTEEGAFIIPGDDKLSLFTLEKRLIESTNLKEIEDCIVKLLGANTHSSSTPRSLATLFGGWELPIPVQHAVKSLGVSTNMRGNSSGSAYFQEFIYILVAKSRQLLNCKEYSDSRRMLTTAKDKLLQQKKFQQEYASGISLLGKLVTMMDWEILLLDITRFISEYPNGIEEEDISDLKNRCRECLDHLQNPTTEVNPRSEIVENILVVFLNLGEYTFVTNFDKIQNQRWPFVEFIALLARVCHELFNERKETSSSYRELWSAVLPIFSNTGGGGSGMNSKNKISTISSKPSILSSRSSLSWVIDRSCSQPLLSVWVSLLAKLHNHILDDVGVQIHAGFLHIWPNILDDVTSSSVIVESKGSRVSGSSKLNSKHIRDFLFTLLERATKITRGGEMFIWLRCLGDVHLASGSPSLAMKCYIEYLAMCTDFFEKANAEPWADSKLFKRMIKCCEMMGCFTQAVVLCQYLSPEVDYSVAFGMAQEKITNDSSDSLYGFIWDLTILEFLINLHTKRNETAKRQQAVKIMGLLELNSNNNEEIQREAMCLRRSQFMRTLAKHYIFV